MCVSDHVAGAPLGFTEEHLLESWLAAVALCGRAGKIVTVPHAITRLPCGCSRKYIREEAQSSRLLYPVDREFRLHQLGWSNAWVHLGCANSGAVTGAGETRPVRMPRPRQRASRPGIARVEAAAAVSYCSYCGQPGHWERDCPHIGT